MKDLEPAYIELTPARLARMLQEQTWRFVVLPRYYTCYFVWGKMRLVKGACGG